MAGRRWLVSPVQGNGGSAAAWRVTSVPACPRRPSLSWLPKAVPKAPWDEGWPLVTRGSGQLEGSFCSRAGPLWPARVPDLRCVCGAPHEFPEGTWPPPAPGSPVGPGFGVCFPVLLGRLFGLGGKRASDAVVSVVPAPFQACCSASWLCTSAPRTLLPQQVSSLPHGRPGAAVGSRAKAVWCHGDFVPVPSRLYSVGWSCTEEPFFRV